MSRGQAFILNSLRSHLPRDARLLLAISGGIDSIVLLHSCREVSRELNLHLEVAHVDHGLRDSSAADARHVETVAGKYGLACHVKRGLAAATKGENVESWGRRIRYEFFAEVLQLQTLNYLVTAHHADDVAETLLMRLVSNKEPGEISRFDLQRQLIRPLLDITSIQIQTYADENALEWREDETNLDESFLRNRIRHSLLPVLREQFDPRIVEVLSLRAQAFAQDSSALDAWANSEAQRLMALQFGSRDWLQAVQAVLTALEPGMQWRVVRDLFMEELGFPLGRSKAGGLVEFLLGAAEGIELPSGLRIHRHAGGISIVPLS